MDFSTYVAQRRARLVRTAVLLGCPRADAEDVVQAALLKCYRSWRKVSRGLGYCARAEAVTGIEPSPGQTLGAGEVVVIRVC